MRAQANVWIAIFSFVGNYFWTHYFFQLLGASYTFKSFRLNGVGHVASPGAGNACGSVPQHRRVLHGLPRRSPSACT